MINMNNCFRKSKNNWIILIKLTIIKDFENQNYSFLHHAKYQVRDDQS